MASEPSEPPAAAVRRIHVAGNERRAGHPGDSKLYEHLTNLGITGDSLLKVEAGILEAEATFTRLLQGNRREGEDFHAYLDPLFSVFAALFSKRNWDESVEETVVELVSDALIERVESDHPPGGPERTENFSEKYGSFWVPAWFPSSLKSDLAAPIKAWGARVILAKLNSTCAPAHDSGAEMTDKGNLGLLRGTDGNLKRAVTLDVARRFGGVSRRAIDDAARKGSLKTEGRRLQRKVLVDSLIRYFPPEK